MNHVILTSPSLYTRLNECADYTTASGKPITEGQVVRISCGLVIETGKFQEDFWTWRAKSEPENIWTTFQAHFVEAQDDLRKRQYNYHQGGYSIDTSHNNMEMSMEFANLELASEEDCAAVTNLTTAKSTLT